MSTELISDEHVGPVLSALLMYGVGGIGFVWLLIDAWRRRQEAAREARIADANAEKDQKLVPGPAILLGRVEYARDAKQAVRVDVDQDGEEWENSGSWSHKWTEKNRRVHVEPFYLRINPDKRIRVEPTRDVFLVDDMDGLIRVSEKKRVKFAELTPGEEVYAAGELVKAPDPEATGEGGGYRSSRDALVLRPRPRESMLISSEPLGNRYRARQSFYTGAMICIILAAMAFHVPFSGYHIRVFSGQTLVLPITNLDHYTTKDDDGDDVYHYRVTAELPSGKKISDVVSHTQWVSLVLGESVPFRVVEGDWSTVSRIGPRPTVFLMALGIVPLLGLVWSIYRRNEKKSKPWYERDVVDTGSGKLEDTLAAEQAISKKRA